IFAICASGNVQEQLKAAMVPSKGQLWCLMLGKYFFAPATVYYFSGKTDQNVPIVEPFNSGHGVAGYLSQQVAEELAVATRNHPEFRNLLVFFSIHSAEASVSEKSPTPPYRVIIDYANKDDLGRGPSFASISDCTLEEH